MNEKLKVVFGLLGGLALFLFGMNLMSESLKKTAGARIKAILSVLGKNPLLGILAGAFSTAILQSSSATTVMVIGFVSAGVMSLPVAIAIIFGANIGTTITAQIIAFKLSNYIYAFIFIGFLISFVVKNQKWKNIGITIFAFGLLFLGIETMGGVMKPLAKSAVFIQMMKNVSGIPVLGVLTGTLMTVIVQSSSATIAVLQNFASQDTGDGMTSVIGLGGAIPILLGDNIGTTITALLAAVGQSKNAKRSAIAHSLFNISGALVFIWIIPLFARFVQAVSPKGIEVEVISRQIANAHTLFNVSMTIIWIPLLKVMVKIVTKLVKDDEPKKNLPTADIENLLNYRLLNEPESALLLIQSKVEKVLNFAMLTKEKVSENRIEDEQEFFDEVLFVQRESEKLMNYITALIATNNLSDDQSVLCEELIIKLHKAEKKLNKAVKKGVKYGHDFSFGR
ncbi:MAG: Na/Pi cotransporter family protein [Treponema sp.]|nr:Na/Pi cotransporter family protein [Treponema sp.]